MKNIMSTDMEYPSAQQSIRVLQEDNVRLLKLVQRYSCFTKMFIELCNDPQKEEFYEMEKDYQIILNEIQCSTSDSNHNKKSLPIPFDSDAMQHQIHNYTISNSNINSIGLNPSNNVMDNLQLFDELDMNSQFTMNGYLARAMNQNNMHELFSRPIMNSPTRQLSLDNESLILNQLNIPNQISMNTFQVESNDFNRTSEENNLIQILRTNQALSQQQPKLYFPLPDTQPQSPESLVKFAGNPFLSYTDVSQQQQQQQPPQQQQLQDLSLQSVSLQTDQMLFDPNQSQYDLNTDSNMSMLMRLSSATSSSNSLLPPMNTSRMNMFVDHQNQLQQTVQIEPDNQQIQQDQSSQQQQQQQQQPQLVQSAPHSDQNNNGQLVENRVHHKPPGQTVLYQPNEETLDLSQNMTDGIHLHRRKLKLTSNYHHNHSLNDNNNSNQNSNNNNNNNNNINNNNDNNNNGTNDRNQQQIGIVTSEKQDQLQLQQQSQSAPQQQQLQLAQQQQQQQQAPQLVPSTPLDARIDSIVQNDLIKAPEIQPEATIDLSRNENYYDDSMFKENGKIPCTFPDCNELSTNQIALSMHMKRKHSILRPFKCKIDGCKAEFKELHKLKVHAVVHTKDKPFKCDFPGCNARFSQSGHVSRHKKNHSQGSNFVCTWEGCNKQFKQKHNLKIHLINHRGGEKPWACDVKGCNRAFVEKWKLVKHKKTHLRPPAQRD